MNYLSYFAIMIPIMLALLGVLLAQIKWKLTEISKKLDK